MRQKLRAPITMRTEATKDEEEKYMCITPLERRGFGSVVKEATAVKNRYK